MEDSTNYAFKLACVESQVNRICETLTGAHWSLQCWLQMRHF